MDLLRSKHEFAAIEARQGRSAPKIPSGRTARGSPGTGSARTTCSSEEDKEIDVGVRAQLRACA
eukprot:6198414-Pleurochrysis_carterae.AAC.1